MDEHQRRIDAAIKAATLGELRDLLRDLQITDPLPPPAPPQAQSRRRVVLAVAGGLVVLAGVLGWAVSGSGGDAGQPAAAVPESPAPPAITKGPSMPVDDVPPRVLTLPREMNTVAGMTAILDEIRKRFGSTMGYELALGPDRAVLALPDPADDRAKLVYTYRGGWGDPSSRPRSESDDLADLAAFDVPAAVAAWAAAPATLQIAPGDIEDTYFDVDHIADPPGPGALEILLRVSTKSGTDGYIHLDPAGQILRVEQPS